MKAFFAFAFLVMGSLTAEETATSGAYIQPCNSWRYNSQAGGYVCSFYSSGQYAEQRDMDNANYEIRQLKQRVNDLEARVSKLENSQPNP